ncbi:MAG: peptidase M50, partial [Gammaproteobacteria bacterium]|nr:peptidase M50 [Gammaproteobacteria bacterium]
MRDKGFRLGEVHGIEIRLDFSVAIIFFLVVYSLGVGLFPQWHADWGPALSWVTALAAALLFFASLLAHELAHSVMAQRHGISVPRITLF